MNTEDDTVKRHAVSVDINPYTAPGAIARNWYHTHETAIDSRTALHDLIPTMVLPITDPRRETVTQAEHPAIKPIEPERREIPYIKYRSEDNPTLLIHGACIAMVQRYYALPAAVFVAMGRIPTLMVETEAITGRKYDSYFRLYHVRGIAGIAIFSDAMLPEDIRKTLPGGHIPLDMCIAVKELEGYHPFSKGIH